MLAKGVDQARFADARLARQQHELAPARARRAPAIKQEGQLLITADEAKLWIAICRCKAAFGSCLAEHEPYAGCLRKAFQFVTAKIFEREGSSHHMSSGVRDRDPVRRREPLEPGCQRGGGSDDRLLARRALAHKVANDGEPSGDSDARLQPS